MILSFKQQFVEHILSGVKIHTIRDDPNRRWKIHNIIQMATGVRTKKYNMFKESECLGIERIFMTNDNNFEVSVGDKYLYYPDLVILAKNDGFEDVESFKNWFIPLIEANPEKCYSGRIIHWTKFRYE